MNSVGLYLPVVAMCICSLVSSCAHQLAQKQCFRPSNIFLFNSLTALLCPNRTLYFMSMWAVGSDVAEVLMVKCFSEMQASAISSSLQIELFTT